MLFCFDMSTKLRAVDDRLQRRSGLFFECPLKMLHFCSWQRTAAHWIVRLSPPLWCSGWTSAGRLGRVYIPECPKFLQRDSLIRYLMIWAFDQVYLTNWLVIPTSNETIICLLSLPTLTAVFFNRMEIFFIYVLLFVYRVSCDTSWHIWSL